MLARRRGPPTCRLGPGSRKVRCRAGAPAPDLHLTPGPPPPGPEVAAAAPWLTAARGPWGPGGQAAPWARMPRQTKPGLLGLRGSVTRARPRQEQLCPVRTGFPRQLLGLHRSLRPRGEHRPGPVLPDEPDLTGVDWTHRGTRETAQGAGRGQLHADPAGASCSEVRGRGFESRWSLADMGERLTKPLGGGSEHPR